MSDENGKISVTLKGGPGYDAPWIVLRADSGTEMVALIQEIRDTNLDVAVRAASTFFQQVATGSPQAAAEALLGATPLPDSAPVPGPAPANSGLPVTPGPGALPGNGVGNYPSNTPPPPPPQQLPQALQPNCKTCGGPTVFKADTKSNPPAWKGWFCATAPRGVKHEVSWVK